MAVAKPCGIVPVSSAHFSRAVLSSFSSQSISPPPAVFQGISLKRGNCNRPHQVLVLPQQVDTHYLRYPVHFVAPVSLMVPMLFWKAFRKACDFVLIFHGQLFHSLFVIFSFLLIIICGIGACDRIRCRITGALPRHSARALSALA